MQVGGRAWRRGRQGYVEQSVSKTGERNNRGQQSPTCKMKKGREEGEVLGAEDQTCNEGRHAAHKSRCFGLPHSVSAVLSCVRSGCIAAPRSDAAADAFMRQFQRPTSVGGAARSLGPPCRCRRCRCHRGRYCGCAVCACAALCSSEASRWPRLSAGRGLPGQRDRVSPQSMHPAARDPPLPPLALSAR